MKKKIIIGGGLIAIIGVCVVLYMFFMPHRDVQSTSADEEINATELVNAFLTNRENANNKYLSDNGESKILAVNGRIEAISEDQLGQKVVLLRQKEDKMGVSCSFTLETNIQTSNFKVGDLVKIKGVIRSGAEYDEDLDLAEDAIVEKCSVVE